MVGGGWGENGGGKKKVSPLTDLSDKSATQSLHFNGLSTAQSHLRTMR